MSSKTNLHKNYLEYLDIYGFTTGLRIKGHHRKRSCFGGFLTLISIIITVVAFCFYMNIYISRTQVFQLLNVNKFWNSQNITLTEDFTFAIGNKYLSEINMNIDIFKMKAYYVNFDIENYSFNKTLLTPFYCKQENWRNVEDQYEFLNLDKAFCYNVTGIELSGNSYTRFFNYITIEYDINIYNGRNNDQRDVYNRNLSDTIAELMPNANFYFREGIFEVASGSNNPSYYINSIGINITYGDIKELNIGLSEDKMTINDDGIIFYNHIDKYAFVVSSYDEKISVRTENQTKSLNINLSSSKNKNVITVNYMSFSEMLARLGAIIQNIFNVFFIISYFSSFWNYELDLHNDMINRIYGFNEQEDTSKTSKENNGFNNEFNNDFDCSNSNNNSSNGNCYKSSSNVDGRRLKFKLSNCNNSNTETYNGNKNKIISCMNGNGSTGNNMILTGNFYNNNSSNLSDSNNKINVSILNGNFNLTNESFRSIQNCDYSSIKASYDENKNNNDNNANVAKRMHDSNNDISFKNSNKAIANRHSLNKHCIKFDNWLINKNEDTNNKTVPNNFRSICYNKKKYINDLSIIGKNCKSNICNNEDLMYSQNNANSQNNICESSKNSSNETRRLKSSTKILNLSDFNNSEQQNDKINKSNLLITTNQNCLSCNSNTVESKSNYIEKESNNNNNDINNSKNNFKSSVGKETVFPINLENMILNRIYNSEKTENNLNSNKIKAQDKKVSDYHGNTNIILSYCKKELTLDSKLSSKSDANAHPIGSFNKNKNYINKSKNNSCNNNNCNFGNYNDKKDSNSNNNNCYKNNMSNSKKLLDKINEHKLTMIEYIKIKYFLKFTSLSFCCFIKSSKKKSLYDFINSYLNEALEINNLEKYYYELNLMKKLLLDTKQIDCVSKMNFVEAYEIISNTNHYNSLMEL